MSGPSCTLTVLVKKLLIAAVLLTLGSATAQARLAQFQAAGEPLTAAVASPDGHYGPFSDGYSDEDKSAASPFRPRPGPITTDTGKLICICTVKPER